MKNKYIIILFCATSISIVTSAQIPLDTASLKTFELGEVTIVGTSRSNNTSEIQSQELEKYSKTSVSSALNLLPGVSVSQVGGRNEAMVYIRGYDLRQVPVFIDGMPVYVPYDGYIDLARLQSCYTSKISVSKGFSSILYGSNSMGGVINIVTAKPAGILEINGNTGGSFSSKGMNGYNTSVNIGTRHGKWYALSGVSLLNHGFTSMSSDFDTINTENDGKRDNSFTKDIQYHIKAGIEPRAGHEYVISYSGIRSEKGVPVYLGTNPSNKIRYWKYPDWNKDCYYFHTKSTINEKFIVKTRWYYDKYYNVLKSFDNGEYTTQNTKSAFTSIYDDNSFGVAAELGIYALKSNEIKIAVNSKYDHHKEYNKGQRPRHFKDNTILYALENSWKVTPKMTLTGGIGYYSRWGIRADDYNSIKDSVYAFQGSNDHSFNYQAGLFFHPKQKQVLYATVAKKSRFATMKDRYSYRFGTAIPNPDLSSEQSFNTEIGYKGALKTIQWSFAGFYNFIDKTIQQVENVQPGIYQLQNTGKAEFRGIEGYVGCNFLGILSIGSSYTLVDTKNVSNKNLKFVNVPKHKITGFAKVEKTGLFYALIDAEFNSDRFSTSDGKYTTPSYTLFNLNVEYYALDYVSLKAGIHNIFDKLYYITEGYPEEGRTFHFSLTCKLSK